MAARAAANRIRLVIQDNGVGMGAADAAGHGLALHSTLMAVAGGALVVESTPGQMTRAELAMPLARAGDISAPPQRPKIEGEPTAGLRQLLGRPYVT